MTKGNGNQKKIFIFYKDFEGLIKNIIEINPIIIEPFTKESIEELCNYIQFDNDSYINMIKLDLNEINKLNNIKITYILNLFDNIYIKMTDLNILLENIKGYKIDKKISIENLEFLYNNLNIFYENIELKLKLLNDTYIKLYKYFYNFRSKTLTHFARNNKITKIIIKKYIEESTDEIKKNYKDYIEKKKEIKKSYIYCDDYDYDYDEYNRDSYIDKYRRECIHKRYLREKENEEKINNSFDYLFAKFDFEEKQNLIKD
jgi:hypothetical protein